MSRTLFEDDDDQRHDDQVSSFTINKEYEKKYEARKRKQELSSRKQIPLILPYDIIFNVFC
jgi:hypothetical protein